MNRFLAPTAALVIGAVLATGAAASAETEPHLLKLPPFEALELVGTFEVDLACQRAQEVKVEADQEVFDRVEASVKAHTLRLAIKESNGRHWFMRHHIPHCSIALSSLRKLTSAGASKIEITGLQGKELELQLAGAASARLQGQVQSLKLQTSGANRLDAEKLAVESADLDLSGACRAIVNASKRLRVAAAGASHVDYLGDPHLEEDLSGVSSIRKK